MFAKEARVVVEGCWTPDTFPGVGTVGTKWTEVFYGTGDSVQEALDEAIEMAVQCGWEVGELQPPYQDELDEEEKGEVEYQFYVSVYVR